MAGNWIQVGMAAVWVLAMGNLTPSRGADLTASGDLGTTISELKKGTPIRVDLQNGSFIQGKFSAYDDYYGRVWLIPDKDEGTLFRSKSIRLSSIRRVETIQPAFPPSLADALMIPPGEYEAR